MLHCRGMFKFCISYDVSRCKTQNAYLCDVLEIHLCALFTVTCFPLGREFMNLTMITRSQVPRLPPALQRQRSSVIIWGIQIRMCNMSTTNRIAHVAYWRVLASVLPSALALREEKPRCVTSSWFIVNALTSVNFFRSDKMMVSCAVFSRNAKMTKLNRFWARRAVWWNFSVSFLFFRTFLSSRHLRSNLFVS